MAELTLRILRYRLNDYEEFKLNKEKKRRLIIFLRPLLHDNQSVIGQFHRVSEICEVEYT